MAFTLDVLGGHSPVIESVWQARSEQAGTFTSMAVSRCELVFTRQRGEVSVILRGPETGASIAACPADAEFLGITFRLGTVLSALPPERLVDRHARLPLSTGQSFWLDDRALPIPDAQDAGAFVEHLIRQRVLHFEPTIHTLVNEDLPDADRSLRTVQRQFRQTTGLTHRLVKSIERARQAAALLEQGHGIADVVHELDFSDQPHLTKALRRFVGRTPGQILGNAWSHSAWLEEESFARSLELAAD
ncbi:helix-turn-helix domain-containing protein [Deinococcus sp. KSM4-11]|uniref:helix-turn-helix transcriptional regulator n=1 Tax=Deinococcus sp. KSM4-11 TaxID=2568654 RepID=UPI0010A3E392|nr:helix-turn-helix domain-containing protein [Deinococcus sp. KSM4-11]THF83938.1 helix-turn-helix domain-containing protein [Deinococcus sp. KSM4-11]